MSVLIASAELKPWQFSLPHAVRGLRERTGWHLVLTDDVGRRGVGDAVCWPGRGSSETATRAALETLCTDLVGTRWSDDLATVLHGSPEASMAASQAIMSLLAQRQNRGLAHLLWPDPTLVVATSALVSTEADARAAQSRGIRTLKVKVGHDVVARVAAIRAVAPDCRIRLDANGLWTIDEALAAIQQLEPLGIEFIEQPVAPDDLAGLARCRGFGIPIAADESVSKLSDLIAVIDAHAADVVVIKPMFVGGLRAAQTMARVALSAGLGVVISSALESSVGTRALVALASGLPQDFALGLGDGHGPIAIVDVEGYPNPVASSALAYPDRIALRTATGQMTWSELGERVARRAGGLAHLGIVPGDRVGVPLNGAPSYGGPTAQLEWVITAHAVMWLGAQLAPLVGPLESADLDRCLLEPIEDGVAAPERFWPAAETRVVIQTTGSTGTPKAVRLTTEQLVTSAFASVTRLGLNPADRWVACLPFDHIGGLQVLLRSAFYGISVDLLGRFDAAEVTTAIADGATLVSLVPNMLRLLVDAYEASNEPVPSTLRALLVGGGPIPASLLDRATRLGLPVSPTWGFTEAGSQVATAMPGQTALTALPGGRVSAMAGQLQVRGPIVGGTILSHDRGDTDGAAVVVHGRADFTIVSGGLNLDPIEIEACLLAHPQIAAAVVVGVANPHFGMRPAALLVARSGAGQPDPEGLRQWCRSHLAKPKCPDLFIWSSELPLCGPGKIDRRAAAARLADLANHLPEARA